MKKFTQFIALLLAGLLTVTSLTACDSLSDESISGDDGAALYTNLSPEQVYNALLNATDVRYTLDRTTVSPEDRSHTTMIHEKEDRLYSSNWSQTSEASLDWNFTNNIILVDRDNGYDYYRSDDTASWIRRKVIDNWSWTDTIEMLFPACCGSLFTDDDNLEQVASNRYAVKEEVIADFIAADNDNVINQTIEDQPYTVEASMESSGATYIFYVTVKTLDGTISIENKSTVKFTDITIEIPQTYEIEEADEK